jgi:putative SOS response-associated peptidase YedK
MPVVLADTDARTWLGDQPLPAEHLLALCRPCPPEFMEHTEVAHVPKGKVSRADIPPPGGELLL